MLCHKKCKLKAYFHLITRIITMKNCFCHLLLMIASASLVGQTWQHFHHPEIPMSFFVADSVVWAGGDGFGLVQMDLETGEVLVRDRQANTGLLSDRITSLQAGPNGSMWAGHESGLSIKAGDRWYGQDGLDLEFHQFAPVTDSTGWVNARGKIWWFDSRQFIDSLGMNQPGNVSFVYQLARGFNGHVWMAADKGLIRVQAHRLDTIPWKDTPLSNFKWPMLPDKAGGVWLIGLTNENEFYYYHPDNGFSIFPAAGYYNAHIDRKDRLWLSAQQLIFHWTPQGIEDSRIAVSVLHFRPNTFQVDDADNLWIAGGREIDGGRGILYKHTASGKRTFFFPEGHGLYSSRLAKFAFDDQYRLYISYRNSGFLSQYDPATGHWDYPTYTDEMLPFRWSWGTISSGPDGKIWTSSDYDDWRTDNEFEGIQVYDPDTDTWEFLSDPPDIHMGRHVDALALSPTGKLAIATLPAATYDGQNWKLLGIPSSSENRRFAKMTWDKKNQLWAIYSQAGLANHVRVHRGDRWDTLSTNPDLPAHWLDMLVDDQNVKWLVAQAGVLKIDDRFPPGLGRGSQWLDRDTLGLQSGETIAVGKLDPNGNLWMVTNRNRLVQYNCEGVNAYEIPLHLRPPDISFLYFSDLAIDRAGRVFIASLYYGMYQMNLTQLPEPAPCEQDAQAISDGWYVFPNPASGAITFSHGNPAVGDVEIRWHDLSGRVLRQETISYAHPGYETSVADFFPGLYLVHFRTGDVEWVEKVLVQ